MNFDDLKINVWFPECSMLRVENCESAVMTLELL